MGFDVSFCAAGRGWDEGEAVVWFESRVVLREAAVVGIVSDGAWSREVDEEFGDGHCECYFWVSLVYGGALQSDRVFSHR